MMGILFGLLYRIHLKGSSHTVNALVWKIRSSMLVRTLLYVIGMGLINAIIWMIVPLQKDMNAWPD
jgi:hypothetical protein